jgi:solute carrier family 25 (mitochondrial carnitine/acylcarnitine transporter), member 20/29
MFHEWLLKRPCDILEVHFLIQNIDRWTVGKFRDRVANGVNDLVDAIVLKKEKYEPWRRHGDLGVALLAKGNKENVNVTTSATTTVSSSPSAPQKGKKRR